MERLRLSVVGIDPVGGTQKFSVPITSNAFNEVEGPIIAGNGYAYLAYTDVPTDGSIYHLMVLRVDGSGNYLSIPIQDFVPPAGNVLGFGSNMITNADTGIVLSWQMQETPVAQYDRTPHSIPGVHGAKPQPRPAGAPAPTAPPTFGMAVITGTSANVISPPAAPGQIAAVVPLVQAQDGSFVGSGEVGSTLNPQTSMIAFDASGNVRWVVPNETPQIATDDGGVIGSHRGLRMIRAGAQWVLSALQVYSWMGNAYTDGPVDQIVPLLLFLAQSYAAVPGGRPGGAPAAGTYVPTLGAVYRSEIAQLAKSDVGDSSRWRETFGTTCNLFVKDVLQDASDATQLSIPYPTRPTYYRFGVIPRVQAFLAADWANPHTNGGCWKPLPAGPDGALPGDVVQRPASRLEGPMGRVTSDLWWRLTAALRITRTRRLQMFRRTGGRRRKCQPSYPER